MSDHELPSDRYLNRELSWLDFNERVLAIAESDDAPLLERAKFLAIFASNLDEFYMVRVAGLKRQVEAGFAARSADGRTPRQQLKEIAARVEDLVERQSRVLREQLLPALGDRDVEITRWSDLDEPQQKEMCRFFSDRIFPVVTPLAVDPGHPFPYISNLSLNLAVLLRDPVTSRMHFARVKVPPLLPRFLTVPTDGTFVPVEDVIAANLEDLFPGMEVVEHYIFRVTRNADLEVDDDGAEDLLQALEEELRKRRFSPAVRLEIESDTPERVLQLLVRELQVEPEDVFHVQGPLDLTGLWTLYELDRPELKDEPFQSSPHPALTPDDDKAVDIFEVLRQQDVLVQHPYDSFTSSVQYFLESAARDPNVLAIKQTLYRTSGDSPIANALMRAAQAGKQVVVLVEIKARFDELANINWARTLEQAGCHVVYGVLGLKTHCKLCLVVRQEGDRLHRYVHIGTGNYNPTTARLYEDLGLLTGDDTLGADVSDLFNSLTGYSRRRRYRSLIVAPHGMRDRIISMIDREVRAARAGSPARIIFKLNNLIDEPIIDALYRASSSGVEVELVVRGICALRPQIPGLSENITVRSILGRFLEHSRIFYFHNGGREEFYIGSADLMHRNLDRRVESLVSVTAEPQQAQLMAILELALNDSAGAWELDGDGLWRRASSAEGTPLDLQATLMELAAQRA